MQCGHVTKHKSRGTSTAYNGHVAEIMWSIGEPQFDCLQWFIRQLLAFVSVVPMIMAEAGGADDCIFDEEEDDSILAAKEWKKIELARLNVSLWCWHAQMRWQV